MVSIRILNVDDDEATRYTRSRVLRRKDFEIDEAGTGAAAIEKVYSKRPDVVLLDVHLPDMSGFDVCRRIKSDPEVAGTTVIHLSASAIQTADQAKGLDAGADSYLVEPVDPELLLATVNAMLRMRQAERAVADSARQWQATFEAIGEGVALLDAAGTVVRSNTAYSKIFRSTPEGVVGRKGFELLAALTGAPAETLPSSRVLNSGVHEDADVAAAERWFHVAADPIRDESGKLAGAVHTIADITERRRTEDALRRSNEDLHQFALVASHDLQEPLRMITGYSQLLAKRYGDRLDTEADEFLTFIVDGAERMRRLIDALLEYSRVVDDRPQRHAPVSMDAVVKWAIMNLDVAVRESGAEVIQDELPVVQGDETRLAQVFQNLIGNAIKYRRQEPPRIHVSARCLGDEWLFSVSDNGQGIEQQYLDRIFALFKRLHGRNVPGAGIGLAICSRIVERHGGRIWVESTPGAGSTFYFTIPTCPGLS
jgi:PAS domain S-box-containing protein